MATNAEIRLKDGVLLRDRFIYLEHPILAAYLHWLEPPFQKGSSSLRWVRSPHHTSCHRVLAPSLPCWRPSPTSTGMLEENIDQHPPASAPSEVCLVTPAEVQPRKDRQTPLGILPPAQTRDALHRYERELWGTHAQERSYREMVKFSVKIQL